ncbi:MAG: ATP-binding protein [Candidatus Ancaeobacter aquaticus]|nr:ATP-binding protein [Candidatus Ancaeobacter aquaticus]
MKYISRFVEKNIVKALARNKSVLLLGARQTGKTTLINRLKSDLFVTFISPEVRQRYEKDPAVLKSEVEALDRENRTGLPLVLLDEVQKVPAVLDVVQDLIDRKRANFVLTGSSARKLRKGHNVNLLPGRIVVLKLDPLVIKESNPDSLEAAILYGSLPGIISVDNKSDQDVDLKSYVTTYLEEEVRAEAVVRNIGPFARFLEYAASESGKVVNLRKLSQEIGVSHTTIASYYQIMEDCLIAERIEPLTKSATRKKLTKSQKYMFFDLGVRRAVAREGTELPKETLGHLFEQLVGLELVRCARMSERNSDVFFWRDPDGPEVDWVVKKDGKYIPIEVKWSDAPQAKDAKHLMVFLQEYKNFGKGYIICRTPRKMRINKYVDAIPWQQVDDIIFDLL